MSSAYEQMAKGASSDADQSRGQWTQKQGVDPERAKAFEKGFKSDSDASRWLQNAYKSLAGDSTKSKGVGDSSRQ